MAERRPLLVELDERTLAEQQRRVAPWLTTLAGLQTGYRRLLDDTVPLVADPLVRDWLDGMARTAREHETAVERLWPAFDVPRPAPALLPAVTGAVLASVRVVAGQAQGILAGATGVARGAAWRNLRQLLQLNLDSMGGFSVAQQLGLALGRPRVVEIAFPVAAKKSEQQLLLQELYLEFATDAVLGAGGV